MFESAQADFVYVEVISIAARSLSLADAEIILERLPDRIQAALIARAAEIEYPLAAVIEMAIASFLDTEALGFVDCKPRRGQ